MKIIKTYSDFISEQLSERPITQQQPRQQVQSNNTPPPAATPPAPTPEDIKKEKEGLVAYFDLTFKTMSEWLQNLYGDGEAIAGNEAFWRKWKGTFNDNEDTAWTGLKAQWELDFGLAFTELTKKKDQFIKDVATGGKYASDQVMVNFSKKVTANFDEVYSWWNSVADDSLKDCHLGANDSDFYSWSMNYSTGLKSYTVDCDF